MAFDDIPEDREQSFPCSTGCGGNITQEPDGSWGCDGCDWKKTSVSDQQPLPPLAKKHTGMRVDHSGILGRIAGGCKVRQDQRWMCGEMDKHLMEMANRFYAGEISAVDEFLQLYCLDDDRPKTEMAGG